MSFFSKVRQARRDKTTDKFCAHLCALGIQAKMSERGRPEEKIPGLFGRSLGIIDIQDTQIRWVDVRREDNHENDAFWYIEYGVPDSRITASFHKVEIETFRIKRIPLVGKVVDLKWKGWDFGLGLIERLNHDVSLNKSIMDAHDLEIAAYPEHSCWILKVVDVLAPSRQEWDCYQSIASHLLGTPLPANT